MNSESPLESAAATRYARGAALMLLASVVSAGLLAYVMSGFHLGFYIPLLMPALIGWGVGSAVAFVRVRTRVADPLPAVTAAVLAGCWPMRATTCWSTARRWAFWPRR
jgi:hypothetical protein